MAYRYTRLLFLTSMVLGLASFLGAGDWPDDPTVVVSSFGSANDGSFISGLVFEAEGQRVRTWSDGELIWTSGPGSPEGAVPSDGLVVIEHPDGFRSGYHDVEAQPNLDTRLAEGQWIGYAGADDWTFIIQDSELEKIIDPMTLLPARENLKSSRLGQVTLVSENERLPMVNGMEIVSGHWSLIVDATFEGGERAIPSELSLYWVGERVGVLRFDSLGEKDGKIFIDAPDPVSYSVVYDNDGNLAFRNIMLNAGRGILELRLMDESGDIIRSSWNLSIKSL